MISVLWEFKSLFTTEKVSIENSVFRLHRTTSKILILLSLLTTSMVYFSSAIQCTVSSEHVERVINSYCWIHSTYTLPDLLKNDTTKKQVLQAHPGVAGNTGDDHLKYHKYYQWVCFVLFFQALAFDFPRFLWKSWEGGRIKSLSADMSSWKVQDEEQMKKKTLVLEYFNKSIGYNQVFACQYFFCEILNFVNVILQIYLTDKFVGYAFTTYGREVLSFADQNPLRRSDPMAHAFPKVTKCTFRSYGPSGNIVPHDALCVLPLNLINEKIYLFLWFWFIILAMVSGLALIYRIATIFSKGLRTSILKLRTRGPHEDNVFPELVKRLYLGDWFLLVLLGKNMGPIVYTDFIQDLHTYGKGDFLNQREFAKEKEKYQ